MKTKKVILFIVEGESDKTSLGGILNRILASNSIKFCIVGGDLTSDFDTDISKAKCKVNDCVERFLATQPGIYKEDLIKIVHLIDMDGAYVDNKQIKTKDIEKLLYTESAIYSKNVESVIRRNERKQQIINRLYTCKKISNIPYRMYYFSCNLEHVLHNNMNLEDCFKMEFADEFSDRYYKNENKFLEFIQNELFAVPGDYIKSWEFIKSDGNSLKRYCNFHLFFNIV